MHLETYVNSAFPLANNHQWCRKNQTVSFQASFAISLEDDDVSAGDIRAEIIGPDSTHNVHFNWVGRTGHGYFTPTETGLHRVSENPCDRLLVKSNAMSLTQKYG